MIAFAVSTALLLLLLGDVAVDGFAVPRVRLMTAASRTRLAMAKNDVSIPYDAAAKVAYKEWRAKFSKGGYDEARFQVFLPKYLEVTSANIAAIKKARDAGVEPGPLAELDATADGTNFVYETQDLDPPGTGLSDSMKSRLMAEASSGLDADKKQTNVILYIAIAVAILVIAGGKGIFF